MHGLKTGNEMKQPSSISTPLDRMLVNVRVTPPPPPSIKFAGNVYTPG